MTERPQPYIGISGVTNVEQQARLFNYFQEQGLDQYRNLALGVKATHKTQILDTENKYGREWYPVGEEEFARALEPRSGSMNVAQMFLDPNYVDNPVYRKEFIGRIRRRGAKWLEAMQFDMLPWDTDTTLLPFIEEVKRESGLKMLLQAHSEIMQSLGPENIVRILGRYAGALDYILFDASHGKGVRLNTDALRPFLEEAYGSEELQAVGIGVAGGLNSAVVSEDLPGLIQKYPTISWDAEGRLHPTNAAGLRPIGMDMAQSYIIASAEVLRSV